MRTRTVVDRLPALFLALGFALTSASTALADSSVAQALFDEGRRLMKEGNYAVACAKFAESQRIEPAGGTLMNLAACHVKQGKTATAWSEFNDALTEATRAGDETRIKEAKRQVEALEPELSRLRIVATHGAAGLELRLDDTVLGAATVGMAIPVDPGEHRVSASAPGYATWHTRISVAPRARKELTVPALRRLPSRVEETHTLPQVGTPRDRDSVAERSSTAPLAAYVIGGVGVAGLGVGTYFGLKARSKKRDSEDECAGRVCTPDGAALLRDADTAAWISNVGFGVGVAGIAVATYLFVSTPSEDEGKRSVRMRPVLGTGAFGVDATAVW